MKNILTVLTLLTALMSSGYSQDTVQVKAGWNIIFVGSNSFYRTADNKAYMFSVRCLED